jgi:hypothetical protein
MLKKTCFYCGEDDDRVPKLFEKDHVCGRNITEETVLACLNCHAKKTYYQNKFHPSIRKKSANELSKLLYSLVSGIVSRKLLDEKIIEISLLFAEKLKSDKIE